MKPRILKITRRFSRCLVAEKPIHLLLKADFHLLSSPRLLELRLDSNLKLALE